MNRDDVNGRRKAVYIANNEEIMKINKKINNVLYGKENQAGENSYAFTQTYNMGNAYFNNEIQIQGLINKLYKENQCLTEGYQNLEKIFGE